MLMSDPYFFAISHTNEIGAMARRTRAEKTPRRIVEGGSEVVPRNKMQGIADETDAERTTETNFAARSTIIG